MGVRIESLLNAVGDLVACGAERDYPRQVGEVRAPSTVVGTLEDDYVAAHRRCSRPLALRMLASVPMGTVSLSLPATTIRAVSPGRLQTSCDPRCRTTSQPAAFRVDRTSRYFFDNHAK